MSKTLQQFCCPLYDSCHYPLHLFLLNTYIYYIQIQTFSIILYLPTLMVQCTSISLHTKQDFPHSSNTSHVVEFLS